MRAQSTVGGTSLSALESGFHVLSMAPSPQPSSSWKCRGCPLVGSLWFTHYLSFPTGANSTIISVHHRVGSRGQGLPETLQAHVSPWLPSSVIYLPQSAGTHFPDSSACLFCVCHPLCLNLLSANSFHSGKHLLAIKPPCETKCLCNKVTACLCASLLPPASHPVVW